jgi:hypothetical protein
MKLEKALFLIAGIIVLSSSILGYFYHKGFLIITMFVGFMMVQSMFTSFCPMVFILKKLGLKTEGECKCLDL